MSTRTDEERFDRELRRFLDWQAGQLNGSPSADEMSARIAARVVTRPLAQPSGRVIWAFIIVLALLAAAVVVAVVGGQHDRQLTVNMPTATPSLAPSSTL